MFSRLLTATMLLLLSGGSPLAQGIGIEQVASRLQDGVYRLDARLIYNPSEAVLEALEHGVALTFIVKLEVRRKGAWLWEKDRRDQRLHFVLRYHALTSMYELFAPGRKRPQRFATRDGALRALGELSNVQLVKADKIEDGEQYFLRIGVKLDIESLPVPLRPRAYLSSAWSLRSETRTWPLTR